MWWVWPAFGAVVFYWWRGNRIATALIYPPVFLAVFWLAYVADGKIGPPDWVPYILSAIESAALAWVVIRLPSIWRARRTWHTDFYRLFEYYRRGVR